MLLMLAGCGDRGGGRNDAAAGSVNLAAEAGSIDQNGNASATAAPAGGEGGVNPLGSTAVKDAIHRAMRTGETQRWSDAGLSGYAVPSPTADARGCRTVRYTIDQQPARTFPIITACDAG